MSYVFRCRGREITYEGTLIERTIGSVTAYYRGGEEGMCEQLVQAYQKGELNDFLDDRQEHEYLAILRDGDVLVAINDKFGSNEIFYAQRENTVWLTDDLKSLYQKWGERPVVEHFAAYEHLALHSVRPPRTIFEGISAVPMASYLKYSANDSITVTLYWNVFRRFTPKATDYETFVGSVREQFVRSLERDLTETTGVSLSGGIDSGGILAVLTRSARRPIPSVSYGGHGKGTPDLESSRASAAECDSPNTEIYPSLADIAGLPGMLEGLNQPMITDVLLPNARLFQESERRGIQKLAFGLGAEMLLGNLKIARVAGRLRLLERVFPPLLLHLLYSVYARFRKLSQNQKEFLLSDSWAERFVRARGPLLSRERRLYKDLPVDFVQKLATEYDELLRGKGLDLGDEMVCMYLFSWVNYLQRRDMGALSKKYGIECIMPFDTPGVAETLFKAPTAFRKLNRWNKQVIRDLFHPYISQRLYRREVRSLIVSYTKLLNPVHKELIAYLRTSPLACDIIDMPAYESSYASLPEPGLNLIRLVGLALWYDVNWNRDNLENFERVAEALRAHAIKE